MIRATVVEAQGQWNGGAADTVVLDHDARYRRRSRMTSVRGIEFLLDLPQATPLRSGDALLLDDGRLVEVVAAPEPLTEVRSDDAATLARLAWHLGNRHLPVQIVGRSLRLRRDPVIEAMLDGLGARIRPIEAPFEPEGGAYSAGKSDAHDGHRHAHQG